MDFICKAFYDLSLDELYEIMKIRQEVFVVEQTCPYLDADGKDQVGWHLFGRNEAGEMVAYTRILPAGISYKKYPSIGRVLTTAQERGTGTGKLLMSATLKELTQLFGNSDIKISAQCYLEKFYKEFGFEPVGESYLEDDIPHVAMIRSKSNG